MNEHVPTLQWTNQESVERRTVPRMPIRQCCLVRVSRDVVGGSVWRWRKDVWVGVLLVS